MSKVGDVLFVVYGEHCLLTNYDWEEDEDLQVEYDGDRLYIQSEEVTEVDDEGYPEDYQMIEGFLDEAFFGDSDAPENLQAIKEEDYPSGYYTEFTNGLWEEDSFDTLEEAIEYLNNAVKNYKK